MSIRGLSHSFDGPAGERIPVLDDLSIEIEAGAFVCLVGPSGCGKSTLLRLLAGFIESTTGSIEVDASLVGAPSHERGVVFQQPTLYPWLSVLDNVALGPRIRGIGKGARRRTALEHLDLVGLSDVAEFRPYELSGGMQQRVQLARVLANDPGIVLMDEPFGALDAITRDRLQGELVSIWHRRQKTVLFITHSVEEAVFLGTRVLVMSPRPGRIVFDESFGFAGAAVSSNSDGSEIRRTPEFVAAVARVASNLSAAQPSASASSPGSPGPTSRSEFE